MEKNLELTRKAIADKSYATKVAHTRLEARMHRPDMELCRDYAYARYPLAFSLLVDVYCYEMLLYKVSFSFYILQPSKRDRRDKSSARMDAQGTERTRESASEIAEDSNHVGA